MTLPQGFTVVLFSHCSWLHTKKIDYKFKENKKKTKLFQNELETYLTENDNEWNIIISTRYLETLDISNTQASEIIRNEYWIFFLQEVSKTTKINWSIEISRLLQNIDQYISLN